MSKIQRCIIVFCFLASVTDDIFASIVGLEYYVDVDPGEGNGIAISLEDLTVSGATANPFELVTNSLSEGTYEVGVRAQNNEGTWSATTIRRFSVYPGYMDFDNDGLNNTQEILNETRINNADSDSDGYFDSVEVMTDSDPNNYIDTPEFTNSIEINNTSVRFIFPSKQYEEYSIQGSTDLVTWKDLEIIEGTGLMSTKIYNLNGPTFFMRLKKDD